MKNKGLKYSIIYAVIRPEITERLSIGIVIMDGENIEIRYSDAKLSVLEMLMEKPVAHFISKVVKSMEGRKVVKDEADLEYLSRYSNNLISISPLQTINIDATPTHKDWLYRKYVSV